MSPDEDISQDQTDEESTGVVQISLNEFISQNSGLFLVMGVFAALSVYISDIATKSPEEEFTQLGLVSSILIVILLSGVALSSLRDQIPRDEPLLKHLMDVRNIWVVVFITLFTTLVYSVFQIVIGETYPLAIILMIVLFVLLLTILLTVIKRVSRRSEDYIESTELRTGLVAFIVFIVAHWTAGRLSTHIRTTHGPPPFSDFSDTTISEAFPYILWAVVDLLEETLPLLIFFMGCLTFAAFINYLQDQDKDD